MLQVTMRLEKSYRGDDMLTISVYTGKIGQYERSEVFPREYTKSALRRILERCTHEIVLEVQNAVDRGEM